jgi:hypothetical protein
MLNLINIGSAVASRRNLVDPIQRTSMRGLMDERLRAFDLRTEGYTGLNPDGYFHLFLIFM